MPRARKGQTRVIVETPDETELETEPGTEQEQEAERQTEGVLESVPMRTTVKLWRQDRMGSYAYLDAIDADALGGTDVKAGLPAYVKEHYGGGNFRFEIRGPTGKGRAKAYKGGDSFTIDKAIPAKYPREADAEEPARAPAPITANNSMAEMLQSTVLTLVMDLVRQGQESAKLQNELTRASIDQLRANMTQPREERDPLEMFKAMADIMRPAQVAADPIEQLNKVLELQERLSGGSREPSAMGVIADLGPQLLGTLNKALDQRKPGEPPVTIHDPDGTVVARTPAPGPTPAGSPQPEDAVVLQLLGRWVPYLTKWAEQDRDPGWAAGAIFWEVPAGYHAALRAKLEPEDAVTHIIAGFPALAPFAGWLAELRVELLASLNAQDGADTPDDPSGG